ncbi:hypothetical protein GYMLUDRAFT_289126 [Collybiopsis luxurians FD-317 M1]|nr:hypothetical protein GYMLUDRAFT_289126 [Collybiopsis luxurians FD-317 M1]
MLLCALRGPKLSFFFFRHCYYSSFPSNQLRSLYRSSPSLKSSPSRSPSLTLDEPVSSPSSSPSPPAYDSSAASSYSPSSSGSLKRKRAMSDTYPESEPPPISPAMKRFRTAMNSSGLSRSVSDPTSLISQVQRPQKPQEITFSGFQASVLDNWFGQSDLADPFGSNFDPFLGLDPVLSSDSTSTSVMTPLPFQPQPLSIDLADFSFSRSSSISLSSGYDSPSTSPSTPALSASGSLTDLSEDEDGGSSNIDSLFGDVKDGGAVSTISSYESIDGAVIKTPAKVEAKSCASVPTPAEILNNVLAVNGNNIPPPDFSAFELSISDPSLLNLPDFDLSGFPEINLGVDSQLGLQSGTTSEVGSFSNGTLASSMGGNYAEDLDTLFAAWSPRNDSGLEVGFREHWTDPAGPTPTMATFADASAA